MKRSKRSKRERFTFGGDTGDTGDGDAGGVRYTFGTFREDTLKKKVKKKFSGKNHATRMKKAHGVHTNGLKVHRTLQLEPGRVGWGGGDAVGCQARAYLIKGEKGFGF